MEYPPFKNFDVPQALFGILTVIASIGFAYFPNLRMYSEMGMAFFTGLFFLYTGFKSINAARVSQQYLPWYTQASVLAGIAFLLGVLPWLLQKIVISSTVPNAATIHTISDLVLIPFTLLFLLAAIYFFFQGKIQKHHRPQRVDGTAPLRQTARFRPHPKEAREEEQRPGEK